MVQIEKDPNTGSTRSAPFLDGEQVTENAPAICEPRTTSPGGGPHGKRPVGAEVVGDPAVWCGCAPGRREPGVRELLLMMLELDEPTRTSCSASSTRSNATPPAIRGVEARFDAELACRFATTPDALRPWHY
jgi:hypothetical protein